MRQRGIATRFCHPARNRGRFFGIYRKDIDGRFRNEFVHVHTMRIKKGGKEFPPLVASAIVIGIPTELTVNRETGCNATRGKRLVGTSYASTDSITKHQ